jgi:hypothetical protein
MNFKNLLRPEKRADLSSQEAMEVVTREGAPSYVHGNPGWMRRNLAFVKIFGRDWSRSAHYLSNSDSVT